MTSFQETAGITWDADGCLAAVIWIWGPCRHTTEDGWHQLDSNTALVLWKNRRHIATYNLAQNSSNRSGRYHCRNDFLAAWNIYASSTMHRHLRAYTFGSLPREIREHFYLHSLYMVADDLPTQWTRASAAIVLIYFSMHIPFSVLYGLEFNRIVN